MESETQKRARIIKSQKRKIRRLSGWNAFQRLGMTGKSLPTHEYKRRVAELSKEWRATNQADREAFELEAQHQQQELSRLAQTPLPSKMKREAEKAQGADVAADAAVWKNATKKLSSRRLLLNKEAFNQHSLWDLPTQFGEGFPPDKSRS